MTTPEIRASDIASTLSVPLEGTDRVITGLSSLDDADANQLTFVVDVVKYESKLVRALHAQATVLVPKGFALPPGASGMNVDNPRAAFAQAVAHHFVHSTEPGVSPTARIHPDATIDPTAHVGEFTVVRAGAVIGARSEIRDHVVIGRNVRIGTDALVKSHAVIGEEGFGMEKDSAGNNLRIPHIGSVALGNFVEVGNFTTVCSGTIAPTTVGDYTKIDDHVHIAHNCQVGRNVIITACAEVSGSVTVEDDVWIGPNASVIQGVTLGRHSLLGIGAVAVKSVPSDEIRIGNPARRLGDNKNK